MIIAVGSANPVKVNASLSAFRAVWPDKQWEVTGIDVPSGVSAQPLSSAEGISGAHNRAERALSATNADFGVGLEGTMQEVNGKWYDCGWIVVLSRDGGEGIGSTLWLETPKRLLDLVRSGIELGDAVDRIFGTTNAKQANGHFGLMTNNIITREAGYRDGVVSALSFFLHRHLFTE